MTPPGEVEFARFVMPPDRARATAVVAGELVRSEGGWLFKPQSRIYEGGVEEIRAKFKS